jgi:hypothetical protein
MTSSDVPFFVITSHAHRTYFQINELNRKVEFEGKRKAKTRRASGVPAIHLLNVARCPTVGQKRTGYIQIGDYCQG